MSFLGVEDSEKIESLTLVSRGQFPQNKNQDYYLERHKRVKIFQGVVKLFFKISLEAESIYLFISSLIGA